MPVSDYTFNDCKLMTRAKRAHIPQAAQIVEIEAHRRSLGLDSTNIEERSLNDPASWAETLAINEGHNVTLTEFGRCLRLNVDETTTAGNVVGKLFDIFAGGGGGDGGSGGCIDMRAYLLCAAFLVTRDRPACDWLRLLCRIYATRGDAAGGGGAPRTLGLTLAGMRAVVLHGVGMQAEQSDALFESLLLTSSVADGVDRLVCPGKLSCSSVHI